MKNIDLVVTKTPLRVSFLGGGTDIKYFYKRFGGSVLNCAINKYVYVTVKRHSPFFKEKFRINYSSSEVLNKLSKIENNIVRECLKLTKINFPIYISTVSDVPTGSGLGGSSSFTVGLLKALYAIQKKKIDKKKLFQDACKIEIDILKEPIGKQDQVPAVYGGLNFIIFNKNETIKIFKFKKKQLNDKLTKQSLLIWTEATRNASDVLHNQKKNFKSNLKNLINLKDYADKFYKNFKLRGIINVKQLGDLINKSWSEKKKLSKKISKKKIDKIVDDSINFRCYGAKLLGAGGGGFILIIGKRENLNSLKNKYDNLDSLKFNLNNVGSEIISII